LDVKDRRIKSIEDLSVGDVIRGFVTKTTGNVLIVRYGI